VPRLYYATLLPGGLKVKGDRWFAVANVAHLEACCRDIRWYFARDDRFRDKWAKH